MNQTPLSRRALLGCAASLLWPAVSRAQGGSPARVRPYRIYGITYRGMTDVELGFESYFAARKIPVEIVWRDLDRDANKMKGFIDEIRATHPDLVYTWGTSVTLGVTGTYDAPDKRGFISDIPVVFTLVAAPVLAKIVPELKSSRSNITGVTHVAPTAAQIQAMSSYRPFERLGVIYTPSEQNSVVLIDEVREIGRTRGFDTYERTFRLDARRKVSAEGAQDLVHELKDRGAQWLYLPPDSFLGTIAQDVIIPTAMEVGLPTFASTEQLMQAGALSGLVCRYRNIGEFTARKSEQILVEKTAPAAIPIETLKRFSYQIRMAAAERLNLPPPLGMFDYAEFVTDAPGRS